jgi:hypothetical protein
MRVETTEEYMLKILEQKHQELYMLMEAFFCQTCSDDVEAALDKVSAARMDILKYRQSLQEKK